MLVLLFPFLSETEPPSIALLQPSVMEQASYQLLPILSQAYRHTNAPTNRAWAYYSPPMNSSNQAEQPEGQERLNLLPINLFPSRCPIAEGAVEPTFSAGKNY